MTQPVIAVVMAAGMGRRYGGPTPKPILTIGGHELVELSLRALVAGGVTHAVLVANAEVALGLDGVLADVSIPVEVTNGGQSRQESVVRGLRRAAQVVSDIDLDPIVLVHDAVRPLVPASVVREVIDAVRAGAEAVAPAIGVVDSMRRVGPDGLTTATDRATLRAVQTPQGFRLGAILRAHEAMVGEEFTDDLACAERAGHAVTLVAGSPLAMKITEPIDLVVAQALWDNGHPQGSTDGEQREIQ